jgi:hypothetical protein
MKRRDWQAAEEAVAASLDLARAMPSPYAEVKALYVGGLLSAAAGQVDCARERHAAARSLCMRLGERQYAGYIEAALAALE